MKKVLIIRSLQVELVNAFIERLSNNEDYEIYILENHKQIKNINNSLFKKVFLTKNKRDYSLFNISFDTLLEIRKINFDIILIPHKQKGIYGFDNILIMIGFFKYKKILSIQYDHLKSSLNKAENLSDKIIGKIIFYYFLVISLLPFVGSAMMIIFLICYIYKSIFGCKIWKTGFNN